MIKLKTYLDTEYDLDEGIRQWIGDAKRSISGAFRSAMKKIKRLKAGESHSISVSMPKNISEAKEKQTGKKGGELAEVAMIRKLYKMLKSQRVEVYFWEQGKQVSTQYFNKNIFDKNLQDYQKQEGKNKKKREGDWIKHGEAGADHIFNYLNELEGPWDLYRIKLEHLGEIGTGKFKGDVNVIVEVKSTDEVLDYIGNISVKTSLDKTPFKTPSNGLQTGWSNFVLQLLTGKTSNILKKDYISQTRVEKLIASAEKKFAKQSDYLQSAVATADEIKDGKNTPAQRRNVAKKLRKYRAGVAEAKADIDEAYQQYENTIEYELDELGASIGMKSSLSLYMEEIVGAFERYQQAPGDNRSPDPKLQKPKSVTLDDQKMRKEYFNIIKKALDAKIRKGGKEMDELIQGILKLGGIETGLDYVALGVNPDDKDASWAISTLGNKDYKKLEKILRGKLSAHTTIGKRVEFHITKNDKTILTFPIIKEINNARIRLPKFGGGDDEKNISLLKKYAQGYE